VQETQLRRDKDGKSYIETRLYGPIDDGMDDAHVPSQQVKFVNKVINEIEDGGAKQKIIRSVATVDLIEGARYMLGWTMWGDEGATVEYLRDQQDEAPEAHFKTIAKDKLPAEGNDPGFSKKTPSGLLWINAKNFKG